MSLRKASAALAAAVFCVFGSRPAIASDVVPADSRPQSFDTPGYMADVEAPSRQPLMELLNAGGLASPLERYGINIFGYIEGSYTWNFDKPADDVNYGHLFSFEHDEPLLNQLDFTIERKVDASKKQFDLGGRIEWIYGADAGFLHSNGLFDWYDSPRDPENQWDLYMAYVDVAIPVGNGLLVRAGKFLPLLGYESTTPTSNAFYTHSYLFNWVGPFTQTGVLAMYSLNDQWSVAGGITRGWDMALEDNNDAASFLGQIGWVPSKKTTLLFNIETGPQMPDNNDDFRTVLDVVAIHAYTERFSVALDAAFGWESNAAPDEGTAMWYGIAGYAGYVINSHLTLNGRLEWFRDNDGTRVTFPHGTEPVSFYEATVGLTIRPFPNDRFGKNFIIRPELRADYATADVFDAGDDNTQYTAAIDMIYSF